MNHEEHEPATTNEPEEHEPAATSEHPEALPPEVIDVDRWLAQREAMIVTLLGRRLALRVAIEKVDRDLKTLGAEPAGEDDELGVEPTARADESKRKPGRKPHPAKVAKKPRKHVLDFITSEPQKTRDLAELAGVTRSDAFTILKTAHRRGRVRRSGAGGSLWSAPA